MLNDTFFKIIKKHGAGYSYMPSGYLPDLKKMDGIKAVFFDVYGTLLVSDTAINKDIISPDSIIINKINIIKFSMHEITKGGHKSISF